MPRQQGQTSSPSIPPRAPPFPRLFCGESATVSRPLLRLCSPAVIISAPTAARAFRRAHLPKWSPVSQEDPPPIFNSRGPPAANQRQRQAAALMFRRPGQQRGSLINGAQPLTAGEWRKAALFSDCLLQPVHGGRLAHVI